MFVIRLVAIRTPSCVEPRPNRVITIVANFVNREYSRHQCRSAGSRCHQCTDILCNINRVEVPVPVPQMETRRDQLIRRFGSGLPVPADMISKRQVSSPSEVQMQSEGVVEALHQNRGQGPETSSDSLDVDRSGLFRLGL